MFRLKGVEEDFLRSLQEKDVETATFILNRMMSIRAKIEVKTDEDNDQPTTPAMPKMPPPVTQIDDVNVIANGLMDLHPTVDMALMLDIAGKYPTLEAAKAALRARL